MIPGRRALLLGVGATLVTPDLLGAPAQAQGPLQMTVNGVWRQGGFVYGRTAPRALIFVDGEALTTASINGLFVIGFDRDATGDAVIEARANGQSVRRTITVAPHTFPSTSINGLPPSTVDPTDPALLALIREQVALKTEGFASRVDGDDFKSGFVWPLETYRITSQWGSQRVLNGTPARPHYGVDMAAPSGTAIRAPADGKVSFSRSGMHFEGGMTLIDHGQGLITCYLHQSRLDVTAGQSVKRGDAIGRIGMTGRATGPHLCWRMKWRDRNMDPSLMVGARAPDRLA